jgi:AcrR family transcriptional regulator
MPRISAPSNAAQRAETQRRILNAFGELLFSHGLPGLTMTDVARHAGVGRTAVYNYYADIEELLIAYALLETERFMTGLRESLSRLDNPVDRLALYVRAQVEDLSRRHLPPGPAMGAVLSPASFAKLADHVDGLSDMLQEILRDGMDQGYFPSADPLQQAQLTPATPPPPPPRGPHGSEDLEERISRTVRFIQLGAGARFDDGGRPVRLNHRLPRPAEPPAAAG